MNQLEEYTASQKEKSEQADIDVLLMAQCAQEAIHEALEGYKNWGACNSAHEAFAVLNEEVDELWDHVKTKQKNRDLDAMRKEAMQVAAMAIRFYAEATDERRGRR